MVEIEGPKGPQLTIGCNTKVTEGMVIHTNSPNAKEAQKSALEMLLLDHPLDCPICDKAGECKLQDQYMQDGLYDFRRWRAPLFQGRQGRGYRRAHHFGPGTLRALHPVHPFRGRDPQDLRTVHREPGHEAKLTIFPGQRLDNPYSGNVTDICPVGALTLKEFRFKQRVWFLKKTESVCPGCARGCNITVEHNQGRIYRFMPRENPELNKTWICDEGRFSFNYYQDNRVKEVRLGHGTSNLKDGIAQLAHLIEGMSQEEVGGIASPDAALEDLYILKKLFEKRFKLRKPRGPLLGQEGRRGQDPQLAEKAPNDRA